MTRLLSPRDPDYPALLGAISSPPDLWVRGTVVAGDALAIAIVGSRRATAYGLEMAARLGSDLAARGVTIVSGLARGIDGAAHRGALAAGGRTIAVLGSGIDVVYPPEHRDLARETEARGALVSQFAPGAPPLPGHFPARNRVIAGLALGVVIVEAGERSGALITASFAGDLGREVFAVPGRVTSETSRGANGLIRDGAKLVQDWTDVVQELPEAWRRAVRGAPTERGDANRPAAESDEGRVLAMLPADESLHIEQVIARGGLPPGRVAAVLAALELGGWARQLEGQRWVSVAARTRRA
ncbi:MAG: DNA-protecting protein DprA [Candidatus Rokubacteria bacterium]|nr:DNA-protecting protein DprA [Candidatus Rokubacteria bacterium]